MDHREKLQRAASWIREADGMIIGAGAGMGVDSGLPDFRGESGFWRAYPALKAHGYKFQDIADGTRFLSSQRLAWGFYGHRLKLYRDTTPHAGFGILQRWAGRMRHGAFVYTSNVDGQFQKAGFSELRIEECHGSLHMLQCAHTCTQALWPADKFDPIVDETSCMLECDPPRCARCGGVARPNVLMFNDWAWVNLRTERQRERRLAWRSQVLNPVVIEIGAGRAIPSVRHLVERNGPHVIRINPTDYAIDPKIGVGLEGGALDVLGQLDDLMRK